MTASTIARLQRINQSLPKYLLIANLVIIIAIFLSIPLVHKGIDSISFYRLPFVQENLNFVLIRSGVSGAALAGALAFALSALLGACFSAARIALYLAIWISTGRWTLALVEVLRQGGTKAYALVAFVMIISVMAYFVFFPAHYLGSHAPESQVELADYPYAFFLGRICYGTIFFIMLPQLVLAPAVVVFGICRDARREI
ncbi:MAG: hypothetical protein GC186_18720 [Rhodobacteraceae bacterium]|nr:hypothetical protein [Paracoccaceae bacterium]